MLKSKATTQEKVRIIKPRALRKGDTVGIIAPSSSLFQEAELEFTYQWLSKLGLKWKLGAHVFEKYSEYAGSDQARAHDLMSMWCDANIDGILPLRGGNGAPRLLPLIDFEMLAKYPKVFVGYSDITALLISIHQRTGLVCFHGPMATSFFKTSYSYHYFTKALMSNRPLGVVTDPQGLSGFKPTYPPSRLVIAEGKGRGRLIGGCLTLIKQLQGTPFACDFAGKIVFLEDVHEEPHQIDRMLSQLLLGGQLQEAAGIIIGECIGCTPGESNRQRLSLNVSVEAVIADRLGKLGIPVVYGLRLGHGDDQFTVPIGAMATLEAHGQSVMFKIEESASR